MTIVWLIACLAIIGAGIYAGKGISAKQWSGGDRSLGPVAVGCILAATQIGGMSIIGAAQNGYMLGISASWYSIANGLFLFLFALLANLLRKNMPSETIPDYLEHRFSVHSGRIYTYAYLVMGFIYIPIQLKTVASVIQIIVPALDGRLAIILGLTMAALYTSIAGMKGSSIVGKITCFGTYILLAVFLIINLNKLGGYGALVASLPVEYNDWSNGYPISKIISYMLGGCLSAIVMQTFMQAYLSAKAVKTARSGSIIGYVLAAPISVLAAIVGMMARYANPELGDGATAFAWGIKNFAGTALAGVILAFVTMIIIATVAAMILATGTLIGRVYRTQIAPKAEEAKQLKVTRIATFVFAYLTLFAAFVIPSASLTSMFLALVYSCTIPASFSLIGGLMWKRVNSTASVVSMVAGLLTGLIWQVCSLSYIMESVYAIAIVTFAVGIVTTLLTSKCDCTAKEEN